MLCNLFQCFGFDAICTNTVKPTYGSLALSANKLNAGLFKGLVKPCSLKLQTDCAGCGASGGSVMCALRRDVAALGRGPVCLKRIGVRRFYSESMDLVLAADPQHLPVLSPAAHPVDRGAVVQEYAFAIAAALQDVIAGYQGFGFAAAGKQVFQAL